jgi:tetratricopeptide (TPR) repeat protein
MIAPFSTSSQHSTMAPGGASSLPCRLVRRSLIERGSFKQRKVLANRFTPSPESVAVCIAIKRVRVIWCLLLSITLLLHPRSAAAHGALLIRISEMTQQINTATNDLANLYLQRGELYREDENWTAAWQDYAHAQQSNPKLDGVDLCRANLLAASGNLPRAKAMFDKVLAAEPVNAKALLGRARLLVRMGQPEPAISDYRRSVVLDHLPEPEAYLELARLLRNQKRDKESLDALDAGIKKFGPIPLFETEAINLELAANHAEAALRRLEQVIRREVRKEQWHAQRGDILLSAGRSTEARKAYLDALAAIQVLPRRLQISPPLQALTARINSSLANIPSSSSVAVNSGE